MSETAPGGTQLNRPWQTMRRGEVLETLGADAGAGLSEPQVAERLAAHGPNELRPAERTPGWRMILRQFDDFMIWVLLAAVALSAYEGQGPEAVAIVAILLLNAVLGFVQEYRAEMALEALQRMAAPAATVLREGVEREVPASGLVPGDIVLLHAGDTVPTDGRLIEAVELRVDESALTGESVSVRKDAEHLAAADTPLGDRAGMVYASTSASAGRGVLVVTATGHDTETGKIADLLAAQEEVKTPLQRELQSVGKRIAAAVLAIAAIVFLLNVWQYLRAENLGLGEALGTPGFRARVTGAFLIAISLAVAAIPEGLPAIVTVVLSLGVRRMAERNAIVRKLHAVETLGATTFICTDKTGTLTRNEMTVRRLLVGLDPAEVRSGFSLEAEGTMPRREDLELLLTIAASCNDAHAAAEGRLVGDPTETALVAAADGLAAGRPKPDRVAEVPFDSERKRMTTVHAVDGRRVAYVKGAPDVVVSLCTRALLRSEAVELTPERRRKIESANEELAGAGYRTLAMACRDFGPDESPEGDLERDLTYVGIAGLLDPPRSGVQEAIATCRRAGIRVAMVTGDHALTARAIGNEIGLLDGGVVLTGSELAALSDEELALQAERVRIYARVDPEHKVRIVDALQGRGQVVAMTGDGVNDAPALKRADIGVAMGKVGTDVAREAADMILADDDFSTIVEAVRRGRTVFENLRKFILYLLSCNMCEVLLIFVTTFFAATPVLLPLQILWINLVTDGLPALALGVDPASPSVMEQGPRGAAEGILTPWRQLQVLWQGSVLTLSGLGVYFLAGRVLPGVDAKTAQTMLFTAVVLTQLLHAFDFRSESRSVFSVESLRNPWLVAAVVGSVALHSLVLYVPHLRRVFSVTSLDAGQWALALVAALVPVAIIDAVKLALARRQPVGQGV